MKSNWSIQQIWNQQLLPGERPSKVRDYISASDIGGSFLDRYYKMKGVTPSNPFEERTLRIFDAGKAWEQMIVRILRMAGIVMDTQGWVEIPADKDHLKVIGYLDCVIGGKPDTAKAKQAILEYTEKFGLKAEDEFIENRALKLIDYLNAQYPDGLEPVIAEIKTVNSMAFWAHKNKGSDGYFKGYPHHKLQLMTYLLGNLPQGKKITNGRLFYISKDDLCLQETGISAADEDLKKIWLDDIKKMTHYIRNDIKPEKESDVIWNQDEQKWEVNWKLSRSPYLTLITGLSKEAWEEQASEGLKQKNWEIAWKNRAKEHGIDHGKLTNDELKKAVMAADRALKKATTEKLEQEEIPAVV